MQVEKQEGKTISLGTSKLNYLDPRISVAWTLKHDVPIAKVCHLVFMSCFWCVNVGVDVLVGLTGARFPPF